MTKRGTAFLLTLLVVAGSGARAQQPADAEHEALRSRIEQRYDVASFADGIALRPKSRTGDVRLIEISDTIAINGAQVTGRELRERLGADADAIVKLSYLDAATRRALFRRDPPQTSAPPDPAVEAERSDVPAEREGRRSRTRRISRDTVRLLGDIRVAEDEELGGQAVAIMGSVHINGEVQQDVVAVLGSVTLGPKAVVGGDVTSVGGRIQRSAGSEVRGNVTEIAITDHRLNVSPWLGTSIPFFFLDADSAVPRLFGSLFRLVLLALLASMALLLARRTVEASAQRVRENPVQAVLVGIAAAILLVPVIFLTAFVLAISIIGIPLLLLLPFVLVLLCLLALAGFSGTAYAAGQWVRQRFGGLAPSPVTDVAIGVVVILLPVLIARVLGLAGWPMNPLAWLLLAAGAGLEFLAWSGGFGAVVTNTFSRWQSRRVAGAVGG
jgi:hypothetical protein